MFIENALAPNSPIIPTAVGLAILQAYILDWAKKAEKFPKVTYYTTRLNAYIRLAMAAIGTLGVSWTWSATDAHGHMLAITFPAWPVLFAGIYHWFVAYGMQHFSEIILALRPAAQAMIAMQARDELGYPINMERLKAMNKDKGITL